MLKERNDLRVTKSQRSVDAASFLSAVESILDSEYGCTVRLIGDPLRIENMSFSPEYMTQALSLLATMARGGHSSRIDLSIDGDHLTLSATTPKSVYTKNLSSSYLAESSADLGDFSYSCTIIDGEVCTKIVIKLRKCAAIALYAISVNDLAELIRKFIKV